MELTITNRKIRQEKTVMPFPSGTSLFYVRQEFLDHHLDFCSYYPLSHFDNLLFSNSFYLCFFFLSGSSGVSGYPVVDPRPHATLFPA
jgi:hypothetical protein